MSDGDLEPIDPRVASYLKARGEIPVPTGLVDGTTTRLQSDRTRTAWTTPMRAAIGLTAAAALVLAVVIVGQNLPHAALVVGTPEPTPRVSQGSPSPAPEPSALVSAVPSGVAGVTVASMPTLSVADAYSLLISGRLDGRAVAISGYFGEFDHSCPAPMRYVAPLEPSKCRLVVMSDEPFLGWQCEPMPIQAGTTCSWSGPTGGTNILAPLSMPETIGADELYSTQGSGPQPVILIAHADDPRKWQCPSETEKQCSDAFVVDRVLSSGRRDIPLVPPQSLDATGKPLTPRMSTDEVAVASGATGDLLTIALFEAKSIAGLDPRWNLDGDQLVWLVRYIGSDSSAAASDPTRAEEVALVDDGTGQLLGHRGVGDASEFRPARLWVQATRNGVSGNSLPVDQYWPFYRIESLTGGLIREEQVAGGELGGDREVTYLADLPTVLDPGTYTVTAWLAAESRGQVVGQPENSCMTQVTVGQLDERTLNVNFATDQPCSIGPVSSAQPSS